MANIINLGSLCVDHVYQVDAFVGAGETTASRDHQLFPGGKGLNQSLAASRAGAQVAHVGAVGEDGRFLIELLATNSIDIDNVQVLAGASGHAVIQVTPQGQNAIVIAGGTNHQLPPSLIQTTIDALAPDDWLLLQNEINDVDQVLAAAAARNLQVALNVAPVDGREANYDLAAVKLLIVNEVEALALAQHRNPNMESVAEAFAELQQALPHGQLVLTQGKQGLRYAHNHRILSLSAYSVVAVDETAAGDAFIGFLLAAIARGAAMEVALREASAAGALAVTRAGAATSIPHRREVLDFIQQMPELIQSATDYNE
jgi:ribokinase